MIDEEEACYPHMETQVSMQFQFICVEGEACSNVVLIEHSCFLGGFQ